jgi:uncharacterized SAM-binding protein YcdF (DUF218 family)
MTLTLILAALLCATVLARLGWRRSSRAITVASLLGFFAIGCGAVPRLLLPLLQQPYAIRPPANWAPSNAIVLLTAGGSLAEDSIEPGSSAFGRIAETVVLYRDCKQANARCTVLVTGGDASRLDEPLSVTYARTLLQLGVPASDQVLETRSMNTWQNAKFSLPLLRSIGAQRVWLVTSGTHMRRSMLCFEHFGIDATPMRADYAHGVWSKLPIGANVALTDVALHEFLGVAAYHLYAATGWNFLATVVVGIRAI